MEHSARPKSFFRRLFSWRGMLLALVALITFVALLVAEEDWRGAHAWRKYKEDREKLGDRFDVARLLPPQVPEAENLGSLACFTDTNASAGPTTGYSHATPVGNFPIPEILITNQVDAASNFLGYLQEHEPLLASIDAARTRRYCHFNLPYDAWPDRSDYVIAQITRVRQIARLLALRSEAELTIGDPEAAASDVDLLFRMENGLREEPLLISHLVCVAAIDLTLQPIHQGIVGHRWSEGQLRSIEDQLLKFDLIQSAINASYGERDICVNQVFDSGLISRDQMPKLWPHGWLRLEQLNLNKGFEMFFLPRIDQKTGVINPSVNRAVTEKEGELTNSGPIISAVVKHNLFCQMLMPAYGKFAEKTAFGQNAVNMGAIACALERYRLAHREYPAALNDLVPQLISPLPQDIINGEPLKYRRANDGKFTLYSIGWNENDDGGVIALDKHKNQDHSQGDWVW